MNNLRAIVQRHVEEETLRQYLDVDYSTTPAEEKLRILDFAREMIESKVQQILDVFLTEVTQNSPERKKAKKLHIFTAILTIIASTGLAHAVNLENLGYITVCALVLLAVQLYPFFKD